MSDYIDATRYALEAALAKEDNPIERRKLKTHLLGLQYTRGNPQKAELGTKIHENIIAAGDFASLEARVMQALRDNGEDPATCIVVMQDEITIETKNPATILKVLENKPMNEKQRNSSGMRFLAAAAAALFPPHLLGGRNQTKRVKAQYTACVSCGNPTKTGGTCFKCQKGTA